MYYNNITGNEDDDLKFIPLNISEPFRGKDSTWFPIIDIALPAFSEIPNSFASSFSTPFDNSNVQPNTLKTLDFIQGDNANLQKNNQQLQNFEQDFDLEYPSEIFNEELPSYNKNEMCKQNTSKNNMMQQGQGQQNMIPQGQGQQNIGSQNMMPQGQGQQNTSSQNMMPQGQGQQNTSSQNIMPQGQGYQNTGLQNMMPQGQGQQNTGSQNMMPQGQGYQNTGLQNMMPQGQGQQNTSSQNMMPQGQGYQNTGLQNIMQQGQGQQNTGNQIDTGNSQYINNRGYLEEPIHMDILRNLTFEDYLIKPYRGEDENQINQIDNIFKMINNDKSITDTFKAYNVPRPIYELIIKKIIKMTLDNSNCM